MPHEAPWEHHHEIGDPILGLDDLILWTTVGLDVGSATSQIAFSEVTLMRDDGRYVVTKRKTLYESDVILTPYSSPERIDAKRLAQFIDQQFDKAQIQRAQIDTGAVILTGLALAADNARAIADAVADDSGRFVAVSAGDIVEARLAAQGAGMPDIRGPELFVHIDIGGGTTKLSAWRDGQLIGLAAADIGARLLTFDEHRLVVQMEVSVARIAAALGLDIHVGRVVNKADADRLAEAMAADLMCFAAVREEKSRFPELLRTPPLFGKTPPAVDAMMFTGGVSEYIYGREKRLFGDLGEPIGRAVVEAAASAGVRIAPSQRGIRATVLGVSQHSVQLSGNTVFISDPAVLPLRNIPVLTPYLDLEPEVLDSNEIAHEIEHAAAHQLDVGVAGSPAVAVKWRGSATYGRLRALAEGVAEAWERVGVWTSCVVVLDHDVAGALGSHLQAVFGQSGSVFCLDSIDVKEFDYLDIGALTANNRAVPVVVKSLLFAGARGSATAVSHNHHHHNHDHHYNDQSHAHGEGHDHPSHGSGDQHKK